MPRVLEALALSKNTSERNYANTTAFIFKRRALRSVTSSTCRDTLGARLQGARKMKPVASPQRARNIEGQGCSAMKVGRCERDQFQIVRDQAAELLSGCVGRLTVHLASSLLDAEGDG